MYNISTFLLLNCLNTIYSKYNLKLYTSIFLTKNFDLALKLVINLLGINKIWKSKYQKDKQFITKILDLLLFHILRNFLILKSWNKLQKKIYNTPTKKDSSFFFYTKKQNSHLFLKQSISKQRHFTLLYKLKTWFILKPTIFSLFQKELNLTKMSRRAFFQKMNSWHFWIFLLQLKKSNYKNESKWQKRTFFSEFTGSFLILEFFLNNKIPNLVCGLLSNFFSKQSTISLRFFEKNMNPILMLYSSSTFVVSSFYISDFCNKKEKFENIQMRSVKDYFFKVGFPFIFVFFIFATKNLFQNFFFILSKKYLFQKYKIENFLPWKKVILFFYDYLFFLKKQKEHAILKVKKQKNWYKLCTNQLYANLKRQIAGSIFNHNLNAKKSLYLLFKQIFYSIRPLNINEKNKAHTVTSKLDSPFSTAITPAQTFATKILLRKFSFLGFFEYQRGLPLRNSRFTNLKMTYKILYLRNLIKKKLYWFFPLKFGNNLQNLITLFFTGIR